MRDLLVFGVVLISLPLAFRRPFFGLLLFSWLAYMRPQDLCWGFAREMRFSFFAGLTMIAGWYAHEQGVRPFARWDTRTRLMVVLLLLVGISYVLARDHGQEQTRYLVEFLKIMVVALFTSGQVDSRQRLRILVWTIALCLGFYGVKSGLFGVLSGGSKILRGPGGMLEDNNDFALGLVMNIPLLWYLGISERAKYVWIGTRVGVALTVLAVLLTHSRGAFLALAAMTLWIAWRSRRLVQAGAALLVIAGVAAAVTPQHVWDRIASIGEGAQESSAGARIAAWRTALRMIEDHPVFGVGIRSFHRRYGEYSVVPMRDPTQGYVAHNSYLQIWAESGTPALLCYLVLLASVFVVCGRVQRMALRRSDMAWALDYARMLEATTVAFLVGATFLNRGHFDLIYHWLALVTCLGGLASAAYLGRTEVQATRPTGVSTRWRAPAAGVGQWQRAGT
jgi:probable O-glycosylation ligase (exosortase A-associated)